MTAYNVKVNSMNGPVVEAVVADSFHIDEDHDLSFKDEKKVIAFFSSGYWLSVVEVEQVTSQAAVIDDEAPLPFEPEPPW